MTVERYLRLIAGVIVLISAVLAWKISPWFLVIIAFVGLATSPVSVRRRRA